MENFLSYLAIATRILGLLGPVSANADILPLKITTWLPELSVIRHIETQITMPSGARPIGEYTRNYQGITDQDGARHRIGGQFVLGGDKNIHLTTIFEMKTGKDCSVVMMNFDVNSDRVTSVECADRK